MQGQAVCNIRPAYVPDAERLLEIRRRAILELAVPALSSGQAQAWAARRDLAWMTTVISTNPLWVADLDGVIVGWVALDANRVIGLYVDPSYSCRGFGSRLLATAEGELSSSGARTVTLEASWNSEEFYLRRGYEPLTDRPADQARPMRKMLGSH
jgi:putative acetyltransferase